MSAEIRAKYVLIRHDGLHSLWQTSTTLTSRRILIYQGIGFTR